MQKKIEKGYFKILTHTFTKAQKITLTMSTTHRSDNRMELRPHYPSESEIADRRQIAEKELKNRREKLDREFSELDEKTFIPIEIYSHIVNNKYPWVSFQHYIDDKDEEKDYKVIPYPEDDRWEDESEVDEDEFCSGRNDTRLVYGLDYELEDPDDEYLSEDDDYQSDNNPNWIEEGNEDDEWEWTETSNWY